MDDDLNPAFADPVSSDKTEKGVRKSKKATKYLIWLLIGCVIVIIAIALIYKLFT